VKIVTIAFASAIALSAVAPVFAYESELEYVASSMRPDQHQAAECARASIGRGHASRSAPYI
jgi:hypothetical protein